MGDQGDLTIALDVGAPPEACGSGRAQPDARIGMELGGRYRILDLIGRGAMGSVYRARQLEVGRDVAIKVLAPEVSDRPERARRFEYEAKLISRLRHPNTLRLYDCQRAPNGTFFIVTELLEGKPLSAVLSAGRLPLDRALSIADQICGSLAEAHAMDIVHRDLKPANVFLEQIGDEVVVKVLDFGIATSITAGEGSKDACVLCGTPMYMAPEQAIGGSVDARTDIYSLGVMLYEMLSGRPPFVAESLVDMLKKHSKEAPPPMPRSEGLSEGLEEVIRRMLAKAPSMRPGSMTEVRQELGAFSRRQRMGAPAPRPKRSAESERRVVTVVAVELSQKSLGEGEGAALRIKSKINRFAAAVERLEGTIASYQVNGFLAGFGATLAHEDDASRAIHAALEIMKSARAHDPPLAPRIGIETGTVVIGSSTGAPGSGEYSILGEPIQTAFVLRNQASAGEILIGRTAQKHTDGAFDLGPVRRLAIPGQAKELEALAVLTASGRRPRLIGSAATRLQGRNEELALLLRGIGRLSEGRAQVISVLGDAGLGKSRLMSELLRSALQDREDRLARVSIACPSIGKEPYHLVRDLVHHLLEIEDLDELGISALEPLVHALLEPNIRGEGTASPPPEAMKRQIFYTITVILDHLATRRPVLIAVDDLHWADASSLDVLGHLLEHLRDRPILWVLAGRPTEPLKVALSGWRRSAAIELKPLGDRDSRAIVEGLLGAPSAGAEHELHARLAERAGGNPLFLEEIVRNAIETGALVQDERGWSCTIDPENCDVPATLQAVILARVDRLTPWAKRVLQRAAVMGARFEGTLLARICDTELARTLEPSLEELVAAELIVPDPDGFGSPSAREGRAVPDQGPARPDQHSAGSAFAFKHALIQEAIYKSLLSKARKELHEQIATAVEELQPEAGGEYDSFLGAHFDAAGNHEKAALYLGRAGDQCLARYAFRDALRHYTRGLECSISTEDYESSSHARLLEGLGAALNALGEHDAAIERWNSALILRNQEGGGDSVATLYRLLGEAWNAKGERDRAREHFRSGLDMTGDSRRSVEGLRILQALSRLAFRMGDNEQASRLALETLWAAKEQRAPEVIAEAHTTLSAVFGRTGRLEDGIVEAQRALEVALEHRLYHAACRAYVNLATLFAPESRERSVEAARAGLALAERVGDLVHQSWILAAMAGTYCTVSGDCSEGIKAALGSLELDRRLGLVDHVAVPLVILGQIQQCHGDLAASERYFLEALAIAERTGDPQALFACYDGLATISIERDEEARASMYHEKCEALCDQHGYAKDSMYVLPFLC